jgi:hypothetical protein
VARTTAPLPIATLLVAADRIPRHDAKYSWSKTGTPLSFRLGGRVE